MATTGLASITCRLRLSILAAMRLFRTGHCRQKKERTSGVSSGSFSIPSSANSVGGDSSNFAGHCTTCFPFLFWSSSWGHSSRSCFHRLFNKRDSLFFEVHRPCGFCCGKLHCALLVGYNLNMPPKQYKCWLWIDDDGYLRGYDCFYIPTANMEEEKRHFLAERAALHSTTNVKTTP